MFGFALAFVMRSSASCADYTKTFMGQGLKFRAVDRAWRACVCLVALPVRCCVQA